MHRNDDGSKLSGSGCGGADGFSIEEPQDADYPRISSLSYDLESQIFARFPISEFWKLCLVNKRCWGLLKSGEVYNIRREIGFKEPSIFMSATGQSTWWAFDREFKSRRELRFFHPMFVSSMEIKNHFVPAPICLFRQGVGWSCGLEV
ncbi:UNVERIFIED_CONTAM: F-box/kelch-repeat protein [Sesamum angustifolium]|uniref:F-box/kelch-repeat protein n=1 Tax=Sesamum angustifolium TaxID=2727405 RepID=A0AAW2NM97_9LAMI